MASVFSAHVRKRNGKYELVSKKGKVLGTHPTREAALKQESAIESAKHQRASIALEAAKLALGIHRLLAEQDRDDHGRFSGPGGGGGGGGGSEKTVDVSKAHQIPSKDWGHAERSHMEHEFERVHGHQPNDAQRKATEKAHDAKISGGGGDHPAANPHTRAAASKTIEAEHMSERADSWHGTVSDHHQAANAHKEAASAHLIAAHETEKSSRVLSDEHVKAAQRHDERARDHKLAASQMPQQTPHHVEPPNIKVGGKTPSKKKTK